MKFSSREQLLKEADQILRKLRQLREMNEAPSLSGGTPPFKSKEDALKAYMKQQKQQLKNGGMPKIKEVDFGKDAKRFAKGYDGSDTMWKSKTMLSVKDAMAIMKQALPGGYNDFKAELIGKLPSDAKIQLGREGSVCLYVKTNTKPSKSSLRADEINEVEPGLYRIWWD